MLISSMTGGNWQGRLTIASPRLPSTTKSQWGVGSQRWVAGTFAVRSRALIYSICQRVLSNSTDYGLDECLRVVDLLSALILHLNPLQECIQSKGDTNFRIYRQNYKFMH